MDAHDDTAAQGWKRSIATGLVVVAAMACGEAERLPAAEAPAPGGASAGAGGSEGAAGAPEASEEDACPSVRFMGVQVLMPPSGGVAMPFPRSFEGEVAGQGVGLPAESPTLPSGATSSDEVGWLRLAEAAPDDAGTPDAGASADAGARASWTIVGPRGIGEMPAPTGERARITVESVLRTLNPSHYSVVMTIGERLALFHQDSSVDPYAERDGVTLKLGALVCESVVSSDGCTRSESHALEVTVPGGASSSLSPGGRQTLGDYDVLHGDTTTLARLRPIISATGQCSDQHDGPNQVTMILRPSPAR